MPEVSIRLIGQRRTPERVLADIVKWVRTEGIPLEVTNFRELQADPDALRQTLVVRFEHQGDADSFVAAWSHLRADPSAGVVLYRWVGRSGLPRSRVEAVGSVSQATSEARRLNRARDHDQIAEGGEYIAVEARKL